MRMPRNGKGSSGCKPHALEFKALTLHSLRPQSLTTRNPGSIISKSDLVNLVYVYSYRLWFRDNATEVCRPSRVYRIQANRRERPHQTVFSGHLLAAQLLLDRRCLWI